MNQLNCLPQEYVFWGKDCLAGGVARFGDFGIIRPITFTAEPLAILNDSLLKPLLSDGVGCFTDLPAHVPDTAVEAGYAECIRLNAQSIVALGGGSVLDAAKAVSNIHFKRTGKFLPIAALPTTLSGSEFSHYFGITETTGTTRFKRSYAVLETTPRIVVIDPVLISGTPRALLLSSAVKGMDHAVEGMRKVDVDHPHAIMAASGLGRFFTVLEKWPAEVETRFALESGMITLDDLLQLQLAAWQCYFSPASVIYGLSHRIGHILGGTYGLPHSATSCITLAPVIRACGEYYGAKLNAFVPRPNSPAAAESLAFRIERLVTHLGLPSRIGEFDLDKSQLPKIVELLMDHYPNEVGDLGDDAANKLAVLLERLW
ncbi:iron-containing alcohol dehydrogenase [Pseudomonas abietaniphila]